MALTCNPTKIPEVLLIEPEVFPDSRGFFLETFHRRKYLEIGIAATFVQDNRSHSKKGVLRGLHYQLKNPQGKLVYVISGEIWDVVVDIRRGSPWFGKWTGALLSGANSHQVYAPQGFAHGFCVLSETADVVYKCTDYYSPGDDYGIFWADPDLAIDWGVDSPILSEKDACHPVLRDQSEAVLPVYRP